MTYSTNKRSKYNNVPLGLITGLLLPLITYVIVWYFSDTGGASLDTYFLAQKEGKILTNIISLCSLSNLALFFFFLRKNRYHSVRGVIMAVFLIALWVIITKYLI